MHGENPFQRSVQEYAHVTAIVADGNSLYLRLAVQYNVRTL